MSSDRPTRIEVNLTTLTENYRAIQRHVAPAKVMCVLKANAYGHGLVHVGQHMAELGAAYFGVAYADEGIALRQAGVTTPILVMGGPPLDQLAVFLEHDLTLTIPSAETLRQVETAAAAAGKQARIHLKFDTGMGRLGTPYWAAEELLTAAQEVRHCDIEGIYSHFANSDVADLAYSHLQYQRFCEILCWYERQGVARPRLVHLANSGGILQLPESHFDMVRAGILFYGVYPTDEARRTVAVRPALSWKSNIAYVKRLRPHHPVSYGSTWESDHEVTLATLPVGYGDGYFRLLSNRAEVLVGGRRRPVVGSICMDQMMVNLEGDSAAVGDEVVLLGAASGDEITAAELGARAGTIRYEILTSINTRVPRIYLT